MKKISFLVSLIFLLFFTCNIEVNASKSTQDIVYPTYEWNIDDINEKVDRFEHIIIIEVKKIKDIKHFDGEGIDIPVTHYTFRVIESLKGNLDKGNIDISYYGGINEEGITKLMGDNDYDNNKIPGKSDYYILFADEKVVDGDGKILKDSYVVYDSRLLMLLPGFEEKESIKNQTNKISSDRISLVMDIINPSDDNEDFLPQISLLSEPCFIGPDGECVSLPQEGSSFSNAFEYNLSSGTSYKILDMIQYKDYYFKVKALNSFKIVFESEYYSTSNLNVKVYVYNSNYQFLGLNDDSGSGLNYRYEQLLSDNEYVYLKVIATSTGTSKINFEVNEDCYCINSLPDLILGVSSVANNAIVFENIGTQFMTEFLYGVSIWNALGLVDIREIDSESEADLNIDDLYDANQPAIAYWYPTVGADMIIFNLANFPNVSPDQKLDTAIHELGHALGIHHFSIGYGNNDITVSEDNSNVMSNANPVTTVLGPCDRLVYYFLYE